MTHLQSILHIDYYNYWGETKLKRDVYDWKSTYFKLKSLKIKIENTSIHITKIPDSVKLKNKKRKCYRNEIQAQL